LKKTNLSTGLCGISTFRDWGRGSRKGDSVEGAVANESREVSERTVPWEQERISF
jgi:hypothetical protein